MFEMKKRGLGLTFVGCPQLEAIYSSTWTYVLLYMHDAIRCSVPIGSESYSLNYASKGFTNPPFPPTLICRYSHNHLFN